MSRARRGVAALVLVAIVAHAGGAARGGEPAPDGDLGFDLFADEKRPPRPPADDAHVRALERRVRLRRRMLQAHQALGFATLALLAATVVLGQLNYDDQFSAGGDYTRRFDTPHYALGIAATAGFAATGALALFAPNPYPKPIRLDGALVHKIAMALATACFVADVVLGPVAAQLTPGTLAERPLAQAHLALGYGALGFMTLGTLAYVF